MSGRDRQAMDPSIAEPYVRAAVGTALKAREKVAPDTLGHDLLLVVTGGARSASDCAGSSSSSSLSDEDEDEEDLSACADDSTPPMRAYYTSRDARLSRWDQASGSAVCIPYCEAADAVTELGGWLCTMLPTQRRVVLVVARSVPSVVKRAAAAGRLLFGAAHLGLVFTASKPPIGGIGKAAATVRLSTGRMDLPVLARSLDGEDVAHASTFSVGAGGHAMLVALDEATRGEGDAYGVVPPLPPTGLMAGQVRHRSVCLSWSPPPLPSRVGSYTLCWSVVVPDEKPARRDACCRDDATTLPVPQVSSKSGIESTSCTVDNLRPGTVYRFQVSAVNRAGASPMGGPLAVKTDSA
jgi:Fibronectin type III domain